MNLRINNDWDIAKIQAVFKLNSKIETIASFNDKGCKFIIAGVPLANNDYQVFILAVQSSWFDLLEFKSMIIYPFNTLNCRYGLCTILNNNKQALNLCRQISDPSLTVANELYTYMTITKESVNNFIDTN